MLLDWVIGLLREKKLETLVDADLKAGRKKSSESKFEDEKEEDIRAKGSVDLLKNQFEHLENVLLLLLL
nr:hypothetical protein [Tanacetum cinerariifolium]